MTEDMHPTPAPAPADDGDTSHGKPSRGLLVPVVLTVIVALVLGVGWFLYRRSTGHTNNIALSASSKAVTVIEARATTYRPSKRYVATLEPWLSAKLGPQLVAAYVDTVLPRPGAAVKHNDVLATLDCRNTATGSEAVAMGARALQAKQRAAAAEAARVTSMLDGGFVSQNEVDQKVAESMTQQAQILAEQAKLAGTSLEVNDCILRAPFDGEVSDRFVDPGAFVRPGTPILALVDRSTVRIAADVPETDFDIVAPGTLVKIRMLATGRTITAKIARRVPAADATTRTIHFEVDVPDPTRTLPVGTTAELNVDYGEPTHAAEIPLQAGAVRGDKVTVFAVTTDGYQSRAHKQTLAVLGEIGGTLYIDPSFAGKRAVTEGRALLNDDDPVVSKLDTTWESSPTSESASGSGKPPAAPSTPSPSASSPGASSEERP